jgi:hypothetical protein
MSDEQVFAAMEALEGLVKAAESSQKSVQAFVQTSTENNEKISRTAQAAIAEMRQLPQAVATQIRGDVARAVKEASNEAVAELNGTVKRIKTVATWWPLILPMVVAVAITALLLTFSNNRIETVQELNAQIEERRQVLARMPNVVRYTDNGETKFAVEVEATARPMQMSNCSWLIDFK